jgi:hypothetical protein
MIVQSGQQGGALGVDCRLLRLPVESGADLGNAAGSYPEIRDPGGTERPRVPDQGADDSPSLLSSGTRGSM